MTDLDRNNQDYEAIVEVFIARGSDTISMTDLAAALRRQWGMDIGTFRSTIDDFATHYPITVTHKGRCTFVSI